jgi:Domain of unknown function (DUF4259)
MGTWGPGNFDSDYAADHLGIVTDSLIKEIKAAIENPEELEPDEYWGVAVPCHIELLVLIAKQGWAGSTLPEPETIQEWRETFMATWDRCIDDLEPTPEHRAKRREVLERTFEALSEVSRK